eukprot:m.12605 g.12605  ORF g.12605 m.12605 type:complete len:59 (-) comp2961_c0_seq1:8-184(-)
MSSPKWTVRMAWEETMRCVPNGCVLYSVVSASTVTVLPCTAVPTRMGWAGSTMRSRVL